MFFYYLDLSLRSLKRTPLVSLLMIAAIAIGIGVTMTSLSVYYMMSMDPIPHKSHRLFHVQLNTMDDGATWRTEDNIAHQLTYRDAMSLMNADLPVPKTASFRTGFSIHMNTSDVKPFLKAARVVGSDFFDLFEQTFIYGSGWTQAQQLSATPVVVISDSINQRLFGGRDSVGEHIYLDDVSYQVVGVTRNWDTQIKYYDLNNGAFNTVEELFVPISLAPVMEYRTWGNSNGWKYEEIQTYTDRLQSEQFWLQFWVELNNPQQVAEFEQYLQSYLSDEAKSGRFNRKTPQFALRDVNQWMNYNRVVSEDNQVLVALSFMFLCVCLANILGLLLGKFLKRAPEVGVRRALGASKKQIFAQHLVEVSMLGLIGGVLGIGIAQLGLWGVRATYNYYDALATMDIGMLLTAPLIALVSCILAGIYPAWLVCRTTPAIYLKTQ